jgi:hypothetical protein
MSSVSATWCASSTTCASAGTRPASRSDWAEYRHERGEADLRGNVRVVEAVAVATRGAASCARTAAALRLMDEALLVTPEYTIAADTLVRDQRLDHGEAFGNVHHHRSRTATVVTGDHGFFAYDGSWAEVDREPTLRTRRGGSEPVESAARVMRFYRYEDRVVMIDTVSHRPGPPARLRRHGHQPRPRARGAARRPRMLDGDRTGCTATGSTSSTGTACWTA